MVIVRLPLDPRFTDSNPAEGGGFLKAIKIRSTLSFGGEVKPSAHVARLYSMLQIPSKNERRYLVSPNSSFSSPVFPDLLLDGCWYDYQRVVVHELVVPVDIIPPWYSMPVYHLGDEQ
jgi:hypothetical protein